MESASTRYALALLVLAKEESILQEILDEVEQIKAILINNKDFLSLIKDYSLSKDEKKDAINVCFENKIHPYLLNLFYVLIDNNRINIVIDIYDEFIKLAMKELNITQGTIYTTINLTDQQIKAIETKLTKKLNTQVRLTNVIDPSIKGGLKIQVGDLIIDDSVEHRLNDLKDSINIKKGEVNYGN